MKDTKYKYAAPVEERSFRGMVFEDVRAMNRFIENNTEKAIRETDDAAEVNRLLAEGHWRILAVAKRQGPKPFCYCMSGLVIKNSTSPESQDQSPQEELSKSESSKTDDRNPPRKPQEISQQA